MESVLRVISKCCLPELRRMAYYMELYQGCTFIEPKRNRKKQWVNSFYQMALQKMVKRKKGFDYQRRNEVQEVQVQDEDANDDKYLEYLERLHLERLHLKYLGEDEDDIIKYIKEIHTIVKWLTNHKIRFQRKKCILKKFDYVAKDYATKDYIKLTDKTTADTITINKLYMDTPRLQPSTFFRISWNMELPTELQQKIQKEELLLLELQDEVQQLRYEIQEARQLRDKIQKALKKIALRDGIVAQEQLVTDETLALECKVCLTHKIRVVLAKCGHTFCYECTRHFNGKCAVCRACFIDRDIIFTYI